jgi:ABC-type multidrug transport system fused ATPase/permease subunit
LSDVRRIAALLRPHAPALAVAAVLAGVISVCRGALVVLVQQVLDELLSAGDPRALWLLPTAVVLLFVVQGAARLIRTLLTRRAALRAEAGLRAQLFAHLLGRSPEALQRDGVGDSLTRLGHDAGKVRTAVGAAVTIVQRPLSAIAVAGAAIWMAPKLAAWAAIGVPVVALVIVWSGRRTRTSSEEHHSRLASLLAGARDALRGARTVQLHGAEAQAEAAFARDNDAQVRSALRTTFFRVAGPPAVELAAATGIALVIAIGSLQVAAGTMTAGSLVAFLVALGLLNEPLKGIAAAAGLWEEARGGLRRVFEVLDRPAGPADAPDARPLDAGAVRLELRGVSVVRGGVPVLAGLDLQVGPGDVVVVQGPSGAGKSTLLDVIAGFVEPGEGDVLWSGAPAARLTLASRRSHLALVDQEPWLGAGTIGDAIALGRVGVGPAAVADAAATVGLDLPLDLGVGDGGRPVSGGERQRIALARALLRDAPVLLLDEPTAHLDTASEVCFLDALRRLAPGRAVLLVSHRPGPLSVATAAWTLVDGRLEPLPLPSLARGA